MKRRSVWVVELRPITAKAWEPHSEGMFLNKGDAECYASKLANRYIASTEFRVIRYDASE